MSFALTLTTYYAIMKFQIGTLKRYLMDPKLSGIAAIISLKWNLLIRTLIIT